jgi:hypothetical protein
MGNHQQLAHVALFAKDVLTDLQQPSNADVSMWFEDRYKQVA